MTSLVVRLCILSSITVDAHHDDINMFYSEITYVLALYMMTFFVKVTFVFWKIFCSFKPDTQQLCYSN